MKRLCRDCDAFGASAAAQERRDACGPPRLVRHRELALLAIAHVDCDAFTRLWRSATGPNSPDHPVIAYEED